MSVEDSSPDNDMSEDSLSSSDEDLSELRDESINQFLWDHFT